MQGVNGAAAVQLAGQQSGYSTSAIGKSGSDISNNAYIVEWHMLEQPAAF